MAFVVVLFTQCKKEDPAQENSDTAKIVPITLEMPIGGSKTDFSGFLTNPHNQNAVINWGNAQGTETIYLAVPNIEIYNPVGGDLLYANKVARMVPLTATVNETSAKVTFTGSVDARILENGKSYQLYYFGNKGGQDIMNDNVLVGKTMSFDGQDGTRENLGNYHFAVLDVTVYADYGNNDDHLAESYTIKSSYPNFTSMMAIALLDLEGETTLEGTAAIESLTVQFNESANVYETTYSATTDITLNNTSAKSFIALCPSDVNSKLECSKGTYTFAEGVDANFAYYVFNTVTDEIEPLKWIPSTK
ncbi:MAG: hypothetical protein E7065_07945 [Lentimicrobiaceae bacterium]|nr:hypothetical protein [Lentimicrobiaceae bacterium]